MRIATLSNASVVHTSRWVQHFRERGHDVRLWSLEPAPPPGALGERRLPSAPLPGVLRYPLAVPALKAELRAFAPDLVDAHYVPNYGVMGALAGVRPLSIAAWGSDLLLAAGRDGFQRWRARRALAAASLVLCDAHNLGEAARTAGAPPGVVRVVPWGVDRERFRPASVREPGLIVSTRMHEPVYDLPVVLHAVARVFASRPEATLVVAGSGSLTPELQALAARTLPAGRVRFVGRLTPEEMAALLARAEVAVSASRSDSTSQSLLEAMAAGALPVVSDIAGNREWVSDGEGARLFTPGSVDELAVALERALADGIWGALARQRNARVIAERGDWHHNLGRIEHYFECLAAGKPLPPETAA